MNNRKILKEFHKLTKDKQQDLRKEYRSKHKKEYQYSIRLFIVYSVIGIVGLLGLFVHFTYGDIKGLYIYTFAFFALIICIYLLNKSNEPFFKFLKNKLKNKD